MSLRASQVHFVCGLLIGEGFPEDEVERAVHEAVLAGAATSRAVYDIAKARLERDVAPQTAAAAVGAD